MYGRALAASFKARSAGDIIAALEEDAGSFSAYAEEVIEGMTRDGAYWHRRKLSGLLGKVHAAIGEPVTWKALTPEALRRIERFMREERHNGANTIRHELSRLRSIVRRGIRDGVVKPDADPFVRFTMPRGVPTERRRLTFDEVQQIAELELEDGTRDRVVRDAWLVAYFGAGVRISDLLLLGADSVKDDRLEYRAQKTDKLASVLLPPHALEILQPYQAALETRLAKPSTRKPSPYLFDLMQQGDDSSKEDVRRRQHRATSKVNKALKRIAVAAGVDPRGFSSHCSRHSFADAARRSGSVHTVMMLLGHSDVSTTQAYLSSFDRDAEDALTMAMWEGVHG